LLDGGTAVFDDLRRTVKDIEFLADPTVGEVAVGCNHALAASFVSVVVDRLSRRYPRVVFRLVTEYVATLHRELIERNVDFLIARKPDPIADERLDSEGLFDVSYSITAGAHNPWARRRRLELAELVNEPWVLPSPGSTTGSVAMEAFRASGLGYPRATVIAEPVEVRMSLLATGRFLSVFPESILRFSPRYAQLKALAVKEALSRVPVGIVTLKNRTISPLAHLFISSARELAKQLPKGKGGGDNVR
jgi:DNA-binding transcriptional LysR family regulator